MDSEKIAATAVQTMKAGDLNRFLVVCALVSDLYCPGYNPSQSLAKDSSLARSAVRYKIDTAKTTTTVRSELSTTKNRPKGGIRAAKEPLTTATRQPKAPNRKR